MTSAIAAKKGFMLLRWMEEGSLSVLLAAPNKIGEEPYVGLTGKLKFLGSITITKYLQCLVSYFNCHYYIILSKYADVVPAYP